jgi:hypothetical protein
MALFGGLFSDSNADSGDQPPRQSIGGLLSSLPDLVRRIVRGEIDSAKAEFVAKLKAAGIGLGFVVGAAVFGFILLEVLVAAAVLGVATALPAWLAALLVAAALLIVVAVLALVGVRILKRGVPPLPTETIKNVKSDVQALKGESDDSEEERP